MSTEDRSPGYLLPEGPDCVLADVVDGVMTITFNRPHRNNGWTLELEERYFALIEQADGDPAVRAVVLTGAGNSFCPGLDLQALAQTAEVGGALSNQPRRPQSYTRRLRKPLVAAINGACAGTGFVQAALCDVRFVALEARLTTAYARRGLVAEHGLSWLLPRLVGLPNALDLLLSGRIIDGSEAVSLGFAKAALPRERVLAVAQAYARELSQSASPMSLASIKWELYRHSEMTSLDRAAREAVTLTEAVSTHPDFAEGVQAFLERRPPHFADPDVDFDPAALAGASPAGTGVEAVGIR